MSHDFSWFTFIDYREQPGKGKEVWWEVLQRFLNYDTDYANVSAIFMPFSFGFASGKPHHVAFDNLALVAYLVSSFNAHKLTEKIYLAKERSERMGHTLRIKNHTLT